MGEVARTTVGEDAGTTMGEVAEESVGGIAEDRAQQVLVEYERALADSPLAPQTRRAYRSRIAGFLAWLADHDGGRADPLTEPPARDAAVRAYRSRLKSARRSRPATINAVLTALDHFYDHLRIGPALIVREEQVAPQPRALHEDETRRLLAAVRSGGSLRDAAIVHTLLHTGVRVAELVALDVEDARLGARQARLVVTTRGVEAREIPLPDESRLVLREWVSIRRGWPGIERTAALFLNRRGGRLSTRSVDALVVRLGSVAGLEADSGQRITPYVLRQTFGHRLLASGADPDRVAELMGHRRSETARRYGAVRAARPPDDVPG
ncbi:site-specific recombinase XerD [Actinoalloteichus sp. GBA129-24]|uniref:Site-specific recombinase XerD n=1 Tax=Actinoalloteichus fjordicus TaxID=1612552 RepID=A0AAC9PT67_9PSEU|nr:site-specific recombinase XerD [Actinoalloteichus fjordicus]APU21878.1 site-specific recombinase XerD [Actinoalloteichus sp. GBA129-24]